MTIQLRCEHCGSGHHPVTAWRCEECHGPLSSRFPDAFSRSDIRAESNFVWRYAATLSGIEPIGGFDELETPLTSLSVNGSNVLAKLDFLTPSGSYKDRGFAVLLSALRQSGVVHVVEDSSGNAAASIAAYAARLGMRCQVFAPAAASPGKLVQAAAYGADVRRVEGSRADVASAAEEQHRSDGSVVYASHNWHPLFIAGVGTWALAVWEQMGCRAPDNVIVPTGSGSLVLGAFRAFNMLMNSGEIQALPRIFAAQPSACAPIAGALDGEANLSCEHTIAEGARIARPVRLPDIVAALSESRGAAVAVPEDAIKRGLRTANRQGIYIEPTSALAVAAAESLLERGVISEAESTVMVLTGSGLKATELMHHLLNEAPSPPQNITSAEG